MTMRKRYFKRILWWSLFTGWLVLTVYLSTQDGTESAYLSQDIALHLWRTLRSIFTNAFADMRFIVFHRTFRKVTHFLIHFVLAFLLVRASRWTFASKKTALGFAWAFAIAVALVDEAVQLVSPGRVSAMLDAGLNLGGAVLGALISSFLGPKKNLK